MEPLVILEDRPDRRFITIPDRKDGTIRSMSKEFKTITTFDHSAGWPCTKWVRETFDGQGNVLEYDWGYIPHRSIQPFLPGFSTEELPAPKIDYPKVNERRLFRTEHFLFLYKVYSNGDEEIRLRVRREYDIAQVGELWMVNPRWHSGERFEIKPFLERFEYLERMYKNIRRHRYMYTKGHEEVEEILYELYLHLVEVEDSYC